MSTALTADKDQSRAEIIPEFSCEGGEDLSCICFEQKIQTKGIGHQTVANYLGDVGRL